MTQPSTRMVNMNQSQTSCICRDRGLESFSRKLISCLTSLTTGFCPERRRRINRRLVLRLLFLVGVLKLAMVSMYYDSTISREQHKLPEILLEKNSVRLAAHAFETYGMLSSNSSIQSDLLGRATLRTPSSQSSTIHRSVSDGLAASRQASRNAVEVSARKVLSQRIDLSLCKVQRLERALVQSANTVVTAYYRLPSKHSYSKYDRWMRNFLSIEDPLVVFTQSNMIERIKELRMHAANRTVIVECELNHLPIRLLGDDFWHNQLQLDPEATRHKSYQLFWVWLSKTWWTVQAVHLNFFESDFFLYSDIGSFRTDAFNNKAVVRYPDVVPDGTILWMAHHPPKPPPTRLWTSKRIRGHFYHSGSLGAGKGESWIEFHSKFAATVDYFVAEGRFVGEDQFVLQSTCLLNPSLCAYVLSDQVNDNNYFGLRYVLHNGPSSAVNSPDNRYRLWRPEGWNASSASRR